MFVSAAHPCLGTRHLPDRLRGPWETPEDCPVIFRTHSHRGRLLIVISNTDFKQCFSFLLLTARTATALRVRCSPLARTACAALALRGARPRGASPGRGCRGSTHGCPAAAAAPRRRQGALPTRAGERRGAAAPAAETLRVYLPPRLHIKTVPLAAYDFGVKTAQDYFSLSLVFPPLPQTKRFWKGGEGGLGIYLLRKSTEV